MADQSCPTCGSTQGFYDGPNGVPRCSKCFHDVLVSLKQRLAQDPDATLELDEEQTERVKKAQDKTLKASDKAMRGPKEPT